MEENIVSLRSRCPLVVCIQHGEYPAANASTGGGCSGGPGGTGPSETQQAFEDQLVMYTNDQGTSCPRLVGGTFPLGPYLNIAVLRSNPITNVNTVVIVGTGSPSAGDLSMGGDGPGGGWKYDALSGKFIANDRNTDSRGVPFDSY